MVSAPWGNRDEQNTVYTQSKCGQVPRILIIAIQCEHVSGAHRERLAIRQAFQAKYLPIERQRKGPQRQRRHFKQKEHSASEEMKKIIPRN